MPRQLMKESETKAFEGTVEMVLLKLRTLTVVKSTEITSPSTPYLLKVIQSPLRTRSNMVI